MIGRTVESTHTPSVLDHTGLVWKGTTVQKSRCPYMCMLMYVHTHTDILMDKYLLYVTESEVRTTSWVSSPSSPCASLGSNSGLRPWQQAFSPTEVSARSLHMLLTDIEFWMGSWESKLGPHVCWAGTEPSLPEFYHWATASSLNISSMNSGSQPS